MVMKPITLPLLYVFVNCFGPDRSQRSKELRSFWTYLPVKTAHKFIQSQFENKNKGLCTVRELDVCRLSSHLY